MSDKGNNVPGEGEIEVSNTVESLISNCEMAVEEQETTLIDEEGKILEAAMSRPIKRDFGDIISDEEEWTEVKGKGKRVCLKKNGSIEGDDQGSTNKYIVYITCKEKMPKQFALAKLLKSLNIDNICAIKYLNLYKIRVEFENEKSLINITTCKELLEKGWKFHDDMEVSFSYGILMHVELEMSEEEILRNIVCPPFTELLSLKRLNKRNRTKEGGWSPSEKVRLCFKGNKLPSFVYIENLKIEVHPYIFPVTQCSRCWKFGHNAKICTYKNIVCPKCGEDHENCTTMTFKCPNCYGNHLALVKTCPTYIKEKKLREIMSELNCTYKKAKTLYVEPTPDIVFAEQPSCSKVVQSDSENAVSTGITFAEVLRSPILPLRKKEHCDVEIDKKGKNRRKSDSHKYNTYKNNENIDWETEMMDESVNEIPASPEIPEVKSAIPFSELLHKLKDIIFVKKYSIPIKIKKVLSVCIQWVILIAVENISDWPFLKFILDYCDG